MKNFLVLAVALMLVACGGGKNVKSGGGGDDTPRWVSQGTGAFSGESGKKLQGVGTAKHSDPKSRRQAADASAKQQLQGGIDALAAALSKSSESTKENVGDDIAGIARKAAQATAHIRDHWVTPDGSETALDQIDLAGLKQALQSAEGDDNLRREMSNNVDRAFDQLSRQ